MHVRLLTAALVVLFVITLQPGAWADQPNVILIITDDQGYGDLSCHGNPVLKTPNMDRIYAESVRFTDFHVAPMCSPTRGQLMTGRDAMKNGCTAVCQGRSMMRSDLPTMANFFEDSGYATGHFGKWHLGDSYPHRPQDRGFQETLHHRAWGITSLADYWENTYFDPVLEYNGVDKKYAGYCTDIFFNESMKWIEKTRAGNKPFFLYLATNTPHVPNVCPEKYSKPYAGQHEGKPIPDTFYGMIANLDENVGELEAFLRTKGLRKNTILVFMSDNGTQSKQAQTIFNAGMRDKKTSVYEGGHRVPCFVRWPAGALEHGNEIDELTEVQDLLPTLIELAGLKEKGTTFDGTSLAGLMKGTESELPDRKLVVQYRVSGEPWDPAVVLWKKWRLVSPKELYHVGNDPGQQTNVASGHPEIVREMVAHYDSWHSEARPLFDQPRWITVGAESANPMTLYAQDWTGGYCDNRGGLMQSTAQGYWNVIVDREGVYELQLRRWPKESEKTLAEGYSTKRPATNDRSARPIAAANVQIAGANYTLDTRPESTDAAFRIKLPAGKTQLSTTMMDGEDRALCSAIYVYLERVPDDEAANFELTPASTRKPNGAAKSKPAAPKKAAVVSQPPVYEVERQNSIEFAKPDGVSLLLDLHLPKGVENPPLILFIHGGGWKGGSRGRCRLDWVAKHGFAIASVEYRLSQEALFPAQIHDCKGALRWLRANAETYGYNADKVIVAGTSAGGHLAVLMGTSGDVAELEGTTAGNLDQSSRVQGVLDYYGPTDFLLRSKSHPAKTEDPTGSVYRLLGGKASDNLEAAKAASPVTYVSKDDPPLLILHGAKDKTVLIEQSKTLRDAYEKLGLEVKLHIEPKGGHGWKGPTDQERHEIMTALNSWFEMSP